MLAWLDIQRNSEVLAKTDKKIAEKLRNQRLIVSQGFRMIVYQEPQDSSSEVKWKDQSCREIWLDQKNVSMNFLPENIIMRATC